VRLLVLTPYPPYPLHSGGALRMYHLLRFLSHHHTVTLLTFAPDEAAVALLEPLREWCRVVAVVGPPRRSLVRRGWDSLTSRQPDMSFRNQSPVYREMLFRLLQAEPFDVVQAESIEMAGYGLEIAAKQQPGPPLTPLLVLDEFNAEYVIQQRAAHTSLTALAAWFRPSRLTPVPGPPIAPRLLLSAPYSLIQWRKLVAYERRLLRSYHHTIAVSEEDRQALHRLYAQAHISIVPNGVDTSHFSPATLPSPSPATMHGHPLTLVFTGSLDYRPNIDAVEWFVQAVLPLVQQHTPIVRLTIVGRQPDASIRSLHNGKTIEVVGNVPDVRPYIARANVYIVPMRIGGGVRLKLLEALAMQVPVVSTSMGAEGVLGLHDENHLLLADDAEAFSRAICRLLNDPTTARRLGEAGRDFVCTHYDWRIIVPRLNQVYEQHHRTNATEHR
jgi:polysaccharide biosynthesis protein PslH